MNVALATAGYKFSLPHGDGFRLLLFRFLAALLRPPNLASA